MIDGICVMICMIDDMYETAGSRLANKGGAGFKFLDWEEKFKHKRKSFPPQKLLSDQILSLLGFIHRSTKFSFPYQRNDSFWNFFLILLLSLTTCCTVFDKNESKRPPFQILMENDVKWSAEANVCSLSEMFSLSLRTLATQRFHWKPIPSLSRITFFQLPLQLCTHFELCIEYGWKKIIPLCLWEAG